MNTKDKQIVKMLEEGKSYTEIQNGLQVSPSKISKIKRETSLRKSNDSTTKNSGSSATSIPNNSKSSIESQDVTTPTLKNISTTDPTTILELRRLELEFEEKMARLKMEEKQRERDFEREKSKWSEESINKEFLNLKIRLSKLELLKNDSNPDNEYELGNDDETEEYDSDELMEEDEDFELSDETYERFIGFAHSFLKYDKYLFDKNDANELLRYINEIKEQVENEFYEADIDYTEYEEWQIIDEAQTDIENIIKRLDKNIYIVREKYYLGDELRGRLEESIK